MSIGNSFLNKKETIGGRAERVWREIRHRYPAGGTITNLSDWATDGIIPSGRPVVYDPEAKTMSVLTTSQVEAGATTANDTTTYNGDSLGINGYLQEDVVINVNAGSVPTGLVASGTVVYAGELYAYMFGATELAVLQSVTKVPEVRFVY